MDFNEALAQLRLWCDQSQGIPIESLPEGRGVFESRSTHTEAEIRKIEECLECTLPGSYHQFMATIGASSLFFSNKYGGGPYFYSPAEVMRVSEAAVLQCDDGTYQRFCFLGEHRSMGDWMGFLISRPGPNNFDVFCHEYSFEEYVAVSDELKSWRSFEEWLIHAVETEGVESI